MSLAHPPDAKASAETKAGAETKADTETKASTAQSAVRANAGKDAAKTGNKDSGERIRKEDLDRPAQKKSLDERIRKAQEASHPPVKNQVITGPLSGLGAALRVGSELLAALIVGVGVGYVLDSWLGTRPWMMVIFFFLGSGAGVVNVYRAASSFIAADDTPKADGTINGDAMITMIKSEDETMKAGKKERND